MIQDFGSFASEDMPHFIILISDGTETMDKMVDAVDDASHVHVVAIDTSNNKYILYQTYSIISNLLSSNANMKDIATKSKGFYVHSGSDVLQVINITTFI